MRKPNPISVIFGVVQTALYLDFAWVYWSRQRVKLRNGGVVDADDLSRGWLLRRIFGSKRFARDIDGADANDDEENAFNHHQVHGGGGGGGSVRPKWGSRGISISADEGVLEHERDRGMALADDDDDDGDDDEEHGVTAALDPDAKMRDPDELARALDEEDDEDPAGAAAPGSSASQQKKGKEVHTDANGKPSGVRNDEWDDD
ncbi:hypothetical protein VTG60DRAFT_410 [Thermothelomyces hinnuleus]